jgi:hypothetical protein
MSVEGEVRTRRPNVEVLIKREAIAVLKPIIADLPDWQNRAANLIGAGEHARSRGQFDQARLKEALALSEAIRLRRNELEESMREWPPAVSDNGRVRDAIRALDSVAITASRACFLLAARRN